MTFSIALSFQILSAGIDAYAIILSFLCICFLIMVFMTRNFSNLLKLAFFSFHNVISSSSEAFVASDLPVDDAVVLEIDGQTGLQTPPLLPSESEIQLAEISGDEEGLPVVAHEVFLETPPAPGDSQIQTQTENETATAQAEAPYSENVSQGGGVNYVAITDITVEAQLNNRRKLTHSSLVIAAQAAVSLVCVWLSDGNHPLSHNAKILQLSLYSVFGSVMGMLKPDHIKLWITGVTCAACLPALVAGYTG